jgi:preprotein translocase subunit SecA
MVHEQLTAIVGANLPTDNPDDWDLEVMLAEVNAVVKLSGEFAPDTLVTMTPDAVLEAILEFADDAYEDKEEELSSDIMRALERLVMLRSIDSLWVEHLTAMDEMRQGIGLQAYGQTDPLVAYKREAHDMWDQLLGNIRNQITRAIYHVELAAPPQPAPPPVTIAVQPGVADDGNGAAPASLMDSERAQRAVAAAAGVKAPPRNLRTNQPVEGGGRTVVSAQKVGRNDPCPCGSGKKYKKCHAGE